MTQTGPVTAVTDPPAPAGPPSAGDDLDDAPRRGWSVGRVASLLVVVGLVVFWVWAFSPWAPHEKANALRDTALVGRIDATCADAKRELAQIPYSFEAKTAADRADQVDRGSDILTTMVTRIRGEQVTDARDQTLLTAWLADWDTYVADRRDYTGRLRVDERAQFTVTVRYHSQITIGMDNFATVMNKLGNCKVPTDV